MSSRADEKERRRQERVEAERADAARARRRRRLGQLAVVAAIAAALVVAGIVLSSGSDAPDAGTRDASGVVGATETRELFAGIPQQGTVLGDPDAPVTLVEYADLQCPFCRDFALGTLPTLIDRYVRDGRVKLDLRLLRFLGPDSVTAARAAMAAAEADRYWPFVELFYRNQGEENSGYVTPAFLRRLGGAIPGLDPAALAEDRADTPAAERRLAAFEASARAAGVDSTPSFLLARGDGAPERLEVSSLEAAAFTGPIDAALEAAG
jgi:protein-disulfide isomerase